MNRYVSEMIGTMVLVLMGCGSAVFAGDMPGAVTTGVGTLGVAIAFGLSVVAMAYAIGGISGCHINPAITLGMYCSGGMGGKDALLYIIFQIIGGILVLVALGATDKKKGAGKLAGLVIGLTLVLVHIVCIPITGTSVNPARSIGPALFEGGGAISQLWLFIVAPLTGGLASAIVWKAISQHSDRQR